MNDRIKKRRRKIAYQKWADANKDKRRLSDQRRRERLKQAAFRKLGDKCANPACQWLNADGTRGCTDHRCLQVDHVNGDGAEDRRNRIVTQALYRAILVDQTGKYQLLCANCNWIKRHVGKEHR